LESDKELTNNHALPISVLLNAEYSSDELVRLGRLAEELGYCTCWYVDVRLMRECYIGLASLALSTKKIHLGTGVTDPYSRHPAITASSIATLDELSGGRAVLGLGLGGSGFRELGFQKVLPVAAMRECIQVIRGLLQGQEVTYAGKVVSISQARLQFTPVRSKIPIYIATQGAQISRLAGELADGVLIANTLYAPAVVHYLSQVADGAARGGRALSSIDVNLRWEICISDQEDEAFDVMRRRLTQRIINSYPNLGYLDLLGVELPQQFLELAARKDSSLLPAAMEALPVEVVRRSVLAGSPDRVASQIAGIMRKEITGITIRPHACRSATIQDVMRRFALEVLPRIASSISLEPEMLR
jgi:5,10-methylenetetrahydromethanopterin reductase